MNYDVAVCSLDDLKTAMGTIFKNYMHKREARSMKSQPGVSPTLYNGWRFKVNKKFLGLKLGKAKVEELTKSNVKQLFQILFELPEAMIPLKETLSTYLEGPKLHREMFAVLSENWPKEKWHSLSNVDKIIIVLTFPTFP